MGRYALILCCGEALIDMLPRETAQGEACFAPHAGGSVFNTAIALGRLGTKVQFFSGLSRDMFGDILQAGLAESHVDSTPAALSDRPTTLAFVKLVDGHATYAFNDENTAGRLLAEADLPTVDANALFFGGISLVVEPCGSTYEKLMLREASTRLTMMDPNIRPSFITDEASYRARLSRMMAAADIIKTSDEDFEWINGDSDVRSLIDNGAKVVLLTRGSEGVTILTAKGEAHVDAVPATVVDTVGAGDTFSAGFLAGLDRANLLSKDAIASATLEQLESAARLGAQAASITVSRAGANPPWAKEL